MDIETSTRDSTRLFTAVCTAIAFVLVAFCSTAAASPFTLDASQLDQVSAGNAPDVVAIAQGHADAVSETVSLAVVKTDAYAASTESKRYRVDKAQATGLVFACCHGGGDTSLSIGVAIGSGADIQVGLAKVVAIETPLISAKVGVGAVIGITYQP